MSEHPLAVPDRTDVMNVDGYALKDLEKAQQISQRHDVGLTLIGLGGSAMAAVYTLAAEQFIIGGAIMAACFGVMVIGKIAQTIVSRRAQLQLGFTPAMVRRVEAVKDALPERDLGRAARILSGEEALPLTTDRE